MGLNVFSYVQQRFKSLALYNLENWSLIWYSVEFLFQLYVQLRVTYNFQLFWFHLQNAQMTGEHMLPT